VARLCRSPWAMELSPFHKVTTYVAGQNMHLCILTVALLLPDDESLDYFHTVTP